MQKALYGLFVILGLALGFGIGVLNATAKDLSMDEIKSLPGYKSYSTLSSFTKHLKSDPTLYQALSANQKLAEKVLGSTSLQRQLLSDIKKAGDSQQVISSYLNEFNSTGDVTGNAFGGGDDYSKSLAAQRQKRNELNQKQLQGDDKKEQRPSQRIGGGVSGNAQLAAQQAIENAQREREAAQKKAEEVIARTEAILANNNANINTANVDLTQAAAIIEAMNEAFAGHPEAEAAFFTNTALLQKVINQELTLDEALAQADITLEEPATTTTPPPTTTPATPPTDQLVQVSGNHYQMNGEDIYDLNHVPQGAETQPDANGWPKYLNVPETCPGPDSEKVFRHITHYVRHAHGTPSGWRDDGPNRLRANYERIGSPFTGSGSTFIPTVADGEVIAQPFVTDNFEGFKGRINQESHWPGTGVVGTQLRYSISYCPGDFDNEHTPAGKPDLKTCNTAGEWGFERLNYKVLSEDNPARKLSKKGYQKCILEPNTKYFFNVKIAPNMSCQESYQDMVNRGFPPAQEVTRKVKGEEKRLCGRMAVHRGILHHSSTNQPYTGPCLKDEPYPLNYSGTPGYCGGRKDWDGSESKECATPEKRELAARTWACYDITGNLPPQRFSQSCVGDRIVWTEGKNVPAHSSYRCELLRDGKHYYGDRPASSGHQQEIVCASHRDGQTRIRTEPAEGEGNRFSETLQQCQFDDEMGRYEWFNISSALRYGATSARYPMYSAPQPEPAHKNVCSWGGKEYALGTVMTQTSLGNHTINIENEKYVCEQRADAPALPRFAHVDSGHAPLPERKIGSCVTCGTYKVNFKMP